MNFKARRMFFVFDLQGVSEDAEHIRQLYFPDSQTSELSITKVTRLKQQSLILELCNYRNCEAEQRQELEAKALSCAKICAKPVYIFQQLMAYLTSQRIVVPGYSFMQDTVGMALTYEIERLTAVVGNDLNDSDIDDLKCLLHDSQGLYEITQLKREPKDFSLSEIKREIRRGQQIRDLYQLAYPLLPQMEISNESIKYYASLVSYYSVYKLKRFKASTAMSFLFIVCYAMDF